MEAVQYENESRAESVECKEPVVEINVSHRDNSQQYNRSAMNNTAQVQVIILKLYIKGRNKKGIKYTAQIFTMSAKF